MAQARRRPPASREPERLRRERLRRDPRRGRLYRAHCGRPRPARRYPRAQPVAEASRQRRVDRGMVRPREEVAPRGLGRGNGPDPRRPWPHDRGRSPADRRLRPPAAIPDPRRQVRPCAEHPRSHVDAGPVRSEQRPMATGLRGRAFALPGGLSRRCSRQPWPPWTATRPAAAPKAAPKPEASAGGGYRSVRSSSTSWRV